MILALILSILLGACSAPSNHYIIEGTTSMSDGYYYLYKGYDLVDSAQVIDGKYRFESEVDTLIPTRNICNMKLNNPWLSPRLATIILDRGTIRVSEDDKSVTGGLVVSGTKGNDALRNFAIKGHQIQEAAEYVFIPEQREKLAKEYAKLVTKTIEKNLDNFAGLYLLSVSGDRFSDKQKAKYLNRLSPEMQKTTAAQILRAQIKTDN